MMIERRILEALDACRPGSDDLRNAEHLELAEARELAREDAAVQEALARVQHFDTEIQAAMEEVSLPAGIADRVKQQLASAAASTIASESPADEIAIPEIAASEITASDPVTPPAVPTEPVSLPSSPAVNRRHWMWGAVASIAAAVLVALGINFFPGEAEIPLTRESLRSLSHNWHELAQENSDWNRDLSLAAKDHPFPIDVMKSQAQGFQNLSLPGDRSAVAYDVSFGSHQATVIVYQGQASGVDLVPPRTPFDTQGVCIGLWQRDGMLFALVVEGTPANYRQLLLANQGNLG